MLTTTMPAVAARFQSTMEQFAQRVQAEGAKAVQTQMVQTRQVIIQTTPVDTGNLQRHWSPVQEMSAGAHIAYGVSNDVEYGPILEYGGYRGVGPKTVRLGGGDLGMGFTAGAGIYSQQAPLGFVRKALAGTWPQYRVRLMNMLKQAWPYSLGAAGTQGPETLPLAGDLGAIFGVDIVGVMARGGLSPSAQQAVSDVLGSMRRSRRRRA